MKARILGPVRLFALGFGVWTLCWLLTPISFQFEYELLPAVLLTATAMAFVTGAYLGSASFASGASIVREDEAVRWAEKRSFRPTMYAIACLAMIGETLRVYDRVVLRGLELGASAVQTRLDLVEQGQSTGVIGLLAGVLFPFCFPVYVAARLGWHRLGLIEKGVIAAVCAYPVLEGFAQGGVTASAMTLLFYFFVNRAIPARAAAAWGRRTVVLMAVVATFFLIAAAIFVERVEFMFGSITRYMALAEQAGTIAYSEQAYELVDRHGLIGFVFIWLGHYYTLGIHEFFYLVQNFDPRDTLYGQYQLYIPLKFLAALGIGEVSSERFAAINPMPGHYQTFWGPAYMDFGVAFPFEGFVIGILTGWFFRACRSGTIWGLSLYPYMQANIVLSFLANGIVGERSYFFVSLAVFCLLVHKRRVRIRSEWLPGEARP